MKRLLIFFIFLLTSHPAAAHSPGQSLTRVMLQEQFAAGEFDICLEDLAPDVARPLILGETTFENILVNHHETLIDAFTGHLRLAFERTRMPLQNTSLEPSLNNKDCAHLRFRFTAANPSPRDAPRSLTVEHNIDAARQPDFSGLVAITTPDDRTLTSVTTSRRPVTTIYFNRGYQFTSFFRLGFEHILSGLDHLLFVMLLVLNAFLTRRQNSWQAVTSFSNGALAVLKLVTAFTIAHSITLALSTLEIFTMPSEVIEPVILLSIIFVGLNNIFHFYDGREWLLVFGFGLFHGFGFATAMDELGATGGNLLLPLTGFNLGVEAGQIGVVLLFLPFFYVLLRRGLYRLPLVQAVSTAITLLACVWLIQRF